MDWPLLCMSHIEIEIQQGAGQTILAVDDSKVLLDAIAGLLEIYGYRVLTAVDGAQALTLYSEYLRDIKVVLTDLVMPGMNGVELSQRLKSINPDIKIIASTGFPPKTYEPDLLKLGVNVILEKPFEIEDLLSAIHGVIAAA